MNITNWLPRATAERLIQLYPNEPFTFPHLLMEHRIQLLAELLILNQNKP